MRLFSKYIAISIAVLSVALLGFGCNPTEKITQKLTEKAVEKGIEKASGGKVDVDINGSNNGSVNIKGENGQTMNFGEDIKVPDNFPKDVLVYPGAKITAAMSFTDTYATLAMSVEDSPNKVGDWYKDKLDSDGWKLTTSFAQEDSLVYGFEKDKVQQTIGISRDNNNEGKLDVTITRMGN